MPYTHGLFGALALSAIFGGIVVLFFRQRRAAIFFTVAAAVFSHWLLDLVVHMPDLWIYDGVKLGFGLWRWLWISLPLELLCLIAGALFYAHFVPARPRGNLWLWLFVTAVAATELYAALGGGQGTPAAAAQTALIAYGALALLAGFVDLSRAKPAL
jgi:hypothetical protein